MSRIVKQPLPDPPASYNQEFMFRLVNAVNLYMLQATAQAETVAARYIATAPVVVDPSGKTPGALPDTRGLPTGMIYFYPMNPGTVHAGPGQFFASIVTEQDAL